MADKQTTNGKEFDPATAFREMRDNYLDAWAKVMVDAVNSDAYAKATGMMLDTYLSVSSPFRQAVEKTMLQTLQQFSMPSRADVIAIAERLTNVEMKLDDIDARLDQLDNVLTKSAVRAAKPAPAKRSKKKGAK